MMSAAMILPMDGENADIDSIMIRGKDTDFIDINISASVIGKTSRTWCYIDYR